MEEWRVVPSDPTLEASSLGRLRVIPHTKNGRSYGGTPTAGQWDGTRFLYCRRGYKTRKVHRLICEAFNGPPPFDGAVVMHDDEDASNNAPSNLKWGTQMQNLNYPGYIAYCKSRTGEGNPVVKGRQ